MEHPIASMEDFSLPKENKFPSNPHQVWETYSMQPTPEQKIYLVFSVSMATICLLTNGILMFVFCRYGLLRSTRNVLLFNQMISGLITTFVVVYPVKIITSPLPSARFWQIDETRSAFLKDYSLCYMVSSGLLLLSIYSTSLNLCVLVLELLLSSIKRLKHWYLRNCSIATWMTAVGVSWMTSVAMSILPLLGWNNWQEICSVPDIWTQDYVVVLASVFFGVTCLEFFAFGVLFVRTERENRQRGRGFSSSGVGGGLMGDDEEEVPICQQPSTITRSVPLHLRRPFSASCEQYQQATRAKITFVHAVICLVTHLPMGVYLLARKSDEQHQQQQQQQEMLHRGRGGAGAGTVGLTPPGMAAAGAGFYQHPSNGDNLLGGVGSRVGGRGSASPFVTGATEADPVLLWTLLPVLFNAVFTPVLYTFMEEPVSTATLRFVRTFACRHLCWPRYTRVSSDAGGGHHQLEASSSSTAAAGADRVQQHQEHQPTNAAGTSSSLSGAAAAAGPGASEHHPGHAAAGTAGLDVGGPT